jgi:dihydroorotate dehydrogenase electron transfer subunit
MDLVPFGNTGPQSAFYALRLTPPDWECWSPGQFVMLRPSGSGSEILWGRPFSICRLTSRDLVLFFQVRGRATSAMSRLRSGDILDVWGPLGNSLALEPKTPTLLLAGGIGIVPFVGYVHAHPSPWEISMEFGHRMPLECYPFDSINEKAMVDAHLEKSDEDREAFLALVDKRIKEFSGNGLVLACGPTPFLRAVQEFSLRHKARTQLCLETRMACGVGACLGCVVRACLPPDGKAPFFARNSSPAESAAPAGASAMPGENGALPHEDGTYVQTCTCGPNFWADSVIFS